MFIDFIDHVFNQIPLVNTLYLKRAAKLKRNLCLLLDQFGMLKPFSFVQWLATYQCNFHCPFCEASAGTAADNELGTSEVRTMIDDLAQFGVKRLVISGGEPLIRHDLTGIMQYAHNKRIALGLVTNGYLVEDLWEKLRSLNYFLYFTSIDGVEEYHDQIRGKKSAFQKAMRALELFGTLDVGTRLINTVIHPGNINQLDQMLPDIKNSTANQWHLTPVAKVGRAVQNSEYHLNASQLKTIIQFVRSNKSNMKIDLGESHRYLGCFQDKNVGKPFFCGAGLTRSTIMPDGNVIGCQQVYNNNLSEGNIREEPFSQIWKTKFTRFREDKRFPTICKNCVHLDACQGGCWAEMVKENACLISNWEREH